MYSLQIISPGQTRIKNFSAEQFADSPADAFKIFSDIEIVAQTCNSIISHTVEVPGHSEYHFR